MARLMSPRQSGDWKGRPDKLSLVVKCFSSGLPAPGTVNSDVAIFERSTISKDRMMSAISQMSKFQNSGYKNMCLPVAIALRIVDTEFLGKRGARNMSC